MSVKHPKGELFIKVYDSTLHSGLTVTEALVYSFLDSFQDGSNYSMSDIASRCGIDIKTARKAIARMEACGAIVVERVNGGRMSDGTRATNLYHTAPLNPTKIGSVNPTKIGSVNPTKIGSVNPTKIGSVNPTKIGSVNPTKIGSVNPTKIGSVNPTKIGSVANINRKKTKRENEKENENQKGNGGDFKAEIVLKEFMDFFQKKFQREYIEKRPQDVSNNKHLLVRCIESVMKADGHNADDTATFTEYCSSFLEWAYASGRDWHRQNWTLTMIAQHFDELFTLIKEKSNPNGNPTSNNTGKGQQPAYSEDFMRKVLGGLCS